MRSVILHILLFLERYCITSCIIVCMVPYLHALKKTLLHFYFLTIIYQQTTLSKMGTRNEHTKRFACSGISCMIAAFCKPLSWVEDFRKAGANAKGKTPTLDPRANIIDVYIWMLFDDVLALGSSSIKDYVM